MINYDKQSFLRKKVELHIRRSGRWKEYSTSLRRIRASYGPDVTPSQRTKAWRSAVDELGIDLQPWQDMWQRIKNAKRRTAATHRLKSAEKKLHGLTRTEILLAVERERAKQLAMQQEEQMRKKLAIRSKRFEDAKASKEELEVRKKKILAVQAELRALAAEEDIAMKQRKQMAEQDKVRAASLPSPTITDDGDVNIARDTAWVYSHIHELFDVADISGVKVLNPNVIKTAPSPGCVALAYFAMQDTKGFLEKFVSKLFAPSKSETRGTGVDAASLDPALEELQRLIQPNV